MSNSTPDGSCLRADELVKDRDVAYPGELMVTDDLFMAALERARELGALIMVHAENGPRSTT